MLELEPWEVALEVRNAAVAAVPTLHQLIGHLEEWPSEGERLDAETWLQAYGLDVDWSEIASTADRFGLLSVQSTPRHKHPPKPYDLVQTMTPSELLAAWEYIVGPAHTDLTDEQWNLLLPLLKERRGRGGIQLRSARDLGNKRRIFNAVRFKLDHDLWWAYLPPRYGDVAAIPVMYRHYQTSGLFARLRDGLQENAEATELVAWLDQVIADIPKKRQRRHVEGGAA
ncbi:transposase [Nocardia brasiliensis]|uniref:transposase n=1 Tax=Nocardia brasiliensis TaxID=37326 RepID=UPI003D94ABC7